ncbi:hypothetical protein MMC17_000309 [Xylographa soralifera]|nr:hypothetical protein [Xylographa soralifera]
MLISGESDWTPIQVHARFLEIVGRTSARVFVGYPLCRDALWLSTSIDFARCIFLGSGLLKVVPSLVRPFAALLTPYIWRIHWHHRNARKLLIPEILRRRAIAKTAPEKWVTERPNDMLQWLEEASVGDDARPESIVHRQLGMSFAAIHTTTNHLTNVIYDLATRWDEYGMELRMEVITSLNEDGGTWKKTTLTKLSKLDSFMKESQRLNPPSALSFNRKLLTPHTLSSDPSITLPASTYIAVAAGPIGLAIQPSPATFDGLRFHRLRTAPGASPHAHQFVTTGPSSMTFGHGKFACPGRFFASNESKMILATLLLKYELKLVGTERPKNLVFADANFPDPNVKQRSRSKILSQKLNAYRLEQAILGGSHRSTRQFSLPKVLEDLLIERHLDPLFLGFNKKFQNRAAMITRSKTWSFSHDMV